MSYMNVSGMSCQKITKIKLSILQTKCFLKEVLVWTLIVNTVHEVFR
jgi:hypothetical protein